MQAPKAHAPAAPVASAPEERDERLEPAFPDQSPEGPQVSEEDRQLGQRIRMMRRERNLSVKDLAQLASLSTGMVSQIERGLSTPSLRSLRLLSVALSVPMSWFFAVPDHPTQSGSPYVVRRGDRRLLRLTPTGVMKELLSPDTDDRLMEMYELTLEAGGSSGADFYNHEGEKAGVVIAGTLRLCLHEESYILKEGDSFQFPSALPHRFDNPGRHLARVLWINSPPAPKRIQNRS